MRISRNQMLMNHAEVAAMRGTCSRLQVGAVFSIEGRIITTGYNGTAKGRPHCSHECDCTARDWEHAPDCPVVLPCTIAQHAERNGIDFAARHGLSLQGSTLHVTHMPCLTCAGSLINVGVTKVVYRHPYRLTEGVEMLRDALVEVVRHEVLTNW